MNNSIVSLIKDKLESGEETSIKIDEPIYAELYILNEAPYYTLSIGESTVIHLETFWRAIGGNKILFTSEDDKQLFGRKESLNVIEEFNSFFVQNKIESILINKPVGDILISFQGGFSIEVFASSCGYESWSMSDGVKTIICFGGGELSIY